MSNNGKITFDGVMQKPIAKRAPYLRRVAMDGAGLTDEDCRKIVGEMSSEERAMMLKALQAGTDTPDDMTADQAHRADAGKVVNALYDRLTTRR